MRIIARGLAAWLPTLTEVSYCPKHDSIDCGFFNRHYCESCIDLGYIEETYEQYLEREVDRLNKLIQELV